MVPDNVSFSFQPPSIFSDLSLRSCFLAPTPREPPLPHTLPVPSPSWARGFCTFALGSRYCYLSAISVQRPPPLQVSPVWGLPAPPSSLAAFSPGRVRTLSTSQDPIQPSLRKVTAAGARVTERALPASSSPGVPVPQPPRPHWFPHSHSHCPALWRGSSI